MNFILWILMGALAGWIASLIMNTNRQQGPIANIVVGVVGAFVGGSLFNFLGATGTTGFNLYSLIVSVVGAVVLLWIMKVIRRTS